MTDFDSINMDVFFRVGVNMFLTFGKFFCSHQQELFPVLLSLFGKHISLFWDFGEAMQYRPSQITGFFPQPLNGQTGKAQVYGIAGETLLVKTGSCCRYEDIWEIIKIAG